MAVFRNSDNAIDRGSFTNINFCALIAFIQWANEHFRLNKQHWTRCFGGFELNFS